MKLLGTILIALTTIAGCKKQDMSNADNTFTPAPIVIAQPANPTDTITYLALGDSYTIGESVPALQSFPFQLSSQLRYNNYRAVDPVIIARTGWTTANLKDAITAAKLTKKFSFVTLLIGVNNQYQNFNPESYHTDFDELVNTAISFANGNAKHVFVLSIPDYSVTPYAEGRDRALIRDEINQYNAINETESNRLGVNYLNITGISRQAEQDPHLLADDGLHPSGTMYSLWVQQLLPQVAASLNK